jgi:eukaryotic-like serine/threonine-protein kinase
VLPAGTQLGPYEIVAPIGAGGMGEVYRARDTRLERTVAVKVLGPQLSASPEARARFEREARVISQLQHPNICVLYDVGQQDGTAYLVMEYLEGETLAQRLARGPLAAPEILKVAVQVVDALDRAHRAGVIHRDLKPGNVMLTKAGAKLLDFGLAKPLAASAAASAAGGDAETLTSPAPTPSLTVSMAGAMIGTVPYMSPEQVQGSRPTPARTSSPSVPCSTKCPPASGRFRANRKPASSARFSPWTLRRPTLVSSA